MIELNLRASRSLPFLAKATGVPLLREAARAMLGSGLSRDEPSRRYHPAGGA